MGPQLDHLRYESRGALALARSAVDGGEVFFFFYLARQLSADFADRRRWKTSSPICGMYVICRPESLRRHSSKGFVYKRVPHVTLKSIANNPDIKEGIFRGPRSMRPSPGTPRPRRYYDQPYEDNKGGVARQPAITPSRASVPHRTISVEEKKRLAEVGVPRRRRHRESRGPQKSKIKAQHDPRQPPQKTGVQNTVKEVSGSSSTTLHNRTPASGSRQKGCYTETDGTEQDRVASASARSMARLSRQLI